MCDPLAPLRFPPSVYPALEELIRDLLSSEENAKELKAEWFRTWLDAVAPFEKSLWNGLTVTFRFDAESAEELNDFRRATIYRSSDVRFPSRLKGRFEGRNYRLDVFFALVHELGHLLQGPYEFFAEEDPRREEREREAWDEGIKWFEKLKGAERLDGDMTFLQRIQAQADFAVNEYRKERLCRLKAK